MEDNKIIFKDEDGTTEEFYVVEETKLNDVNYLLVCESLEKETEAFILKDTSSPEDEEAVYVFVEDDTELEAVADIFAELLEDEDLI
ncbi:MAG: DUF1292 domain-containing protein [Lachnospiraceae bacterium]|nr:DUF1292 domain-containing protein [Lachnospiraceae bacterium]